MKGLKAISLTAAVCLFLIANSAYGQAAYRISLPFTYKNLTIFLIHGADASNNKDLITLEEALDMKVFKVYETEDVNELMVENISPKYDVFIQSGDIVKGGKQDPRARDQRDHSAKFRRKCRSRRSVSNPTDGKAAGTKAGKNFPLPKNVSFRSN